MKLISILFFIQTLLATKVTLSTIPTCVRPEDMSELAALRTYSVCLKSQKTFCEKKDSVPECKKLSLSSNKFPENVVDINPQELCSIETKGAYICRKEPIRFVVNVPAAPQKPSAPSPGTTAIPEAGAAAPAIPSSAQEAPPTTMVPPSDSKPSN